MSYNPFLDALIVSYEYKCNNKNIILTNEKTVHVHGNYFCVICEKCNDKIVLHILNKVDS